MIIVFDRSIIMDKSSYNEREVKNTILTLNFLKYYVSVHVGVSVWRYICVYTVYMCLWACKQIVNY